VPVKYRIDHQRRLILTWGVGTVLAQDMFEYQRTVWSRPDVAGYCEVVDMTFAETIESPTAKNMRDLASLSAEMAESVATGKLAIVAPQQLVFGLGRMYEAYREMQPGTKKEMAVFRTLDEASVYLGIAIRSDEFQSASADGECGTSTA